MGTNRQVPRSSERSALHGVASEFVRLFRSLADPYRPEMHYMRGPGPKWHAKHGARPADAPGLPGLARIEG